MNWDASYVISRSLRLEVSPTGTGKLLAMTSLSRRPQEVDLDALPVLLAFSSGAVPREVFGRLLADWEIEEAGFETVVDTMVEQELLTPAGVGGAAEPSLSASGFGSVLTHLGMLKDSLRVLSYRSAIERQARGKVVVEIGCGTGILSLFAARAGARRVIAIEESKIAEVAARMFAVNDGPGMIDLRIANSRNVELDEPADLIIHEILGVDPFEENLLPVLEDARRRLLRPGGRFLPHRLEVCCLGVELKEPLPEEGRRLAEARELAGLYGLDFAPFLEALADIKPPGSSRKWLGDKTLFEPRILSEESRLFDLDLAADALDLAGSSLSLPLRIQQEGSLGGVVLFFRAHLDEQILITTSPLAPLTHWGWDLRAFSRRVSVSPGDQVPLVVEIGERAGIQGLSVRLA
jgi:protein arginine N-methyltransferase 1